LPDPVKVNPYEPAAAPNADPDATSNVSVPSSLAIVEVAPSVTAPVIEFVSAPAVDTLRMTPPDEVPDPDTVMASAMERFVPDTLSAAPEATDVAPAVVPNAVECAATTVPVEIVVVPV
jgi:hypothetical protein